MRIITPDNVNVTADHPGFEQENGKKKLRSRKKSGDNTSDKPKIKRSDIENAFADLLDHNHSRLPESWPRLPQTFLVQKDKSGEHQYLEELESQVLSPVGLQRIVDCIANYCRVNPVDLGGYDVTKRDHKIFAEYWASSTVPLPSEQIAAVRFKNEPGYCWNRLPWDRTKGPYDFDLDFAPTFKEFMGRIKTNREALMLFVGSLFDSITRQQYLWITGTGNNGKGTFLKFLQRVFGEAFAMEEAPSSEESRFWSGGLIGKRVVAFDDCERPNFVTSGLFKRITGNESIRCETKGTGSGFTAPLQAMFIFTSQRKPAIKNESADIRRLIFCEIESPKHPARWNYIDDLVAEGGVFLEACIETYRLWKIENPYAAQLPVDISTVEVLLEEADQEFEGFYSRFFDIGLSTYEVLAGELYNFVKSEFKTNAKIDQAFEYLKRVHNISKMKIFKDGKQHRFYPKIRKKSFLL